MVIFHDISYAQGAYNMDADPNPVIAMKMSGFFYGSKGGYLDAQAANNYNNAIRTGKVPILYHFAGGADPIVEADYFLAACAPYADGDIYCLDYELEDYMNPPADPANWCLQFCERVHEKTGTWPIFYTFAAMLQRYGFDAVLKNCALWIADYAVSPNDEVPTNGHPYIIHQYQGSPLDTDALFIDVETLKKYGYHAPQAPTPAPTPEPTPAPQPEPTPVTPSVEQPQPTPAPVESPTPTPVASKTLFDWISDLVSKVIAWLKSFHK